MINNGPNRPNHYQNQPNRQTGSRPLAAWILLGTAIVLLVGVVIFAVFAFVGPNNPNNPTSTPGIGNKSPVPGGGSCTVDSPYGFTTVNADSSLVAVYRQLNVCWVRYQYHWDKIEPTQGSFDWSAVDTAIATMNAASIHVDFAIENAPSWAKSQVCPADGKHYLAGATEIADFARVLATRYNGQSGHGTIDSFEIGNEEYDQHFTGSAATSEQCRNGGNYGPVLKAGYQAIKAAYPRALVGMFGQWFHNEPHIQTFMTDLFAGGFGSYMDYMNFHFYNGGQDPAVSHGNIPSFDQWWQTMHDIATKYGFPKLSIWVTEVGWPTHQPKYNPNQPVPPDVQAQYLQYIMDESAKSNVIKKVFWFTINYGDQADNIDPPAGPLPAFQMLHDIVRDKPKWE